MPGAERSARESPRCRRGKGCAYQRPFRNDECGMMNDEWKKEASCLPFIIHHSAFIICLTGELDGASLADDGDLDLAGVVQLLLDRLGDFAADTQGVAVR